MDMIGKRKMQFIFHLDKQEMSYGQRSFGKLKNLRRSKS